MPSNTSKDYYFIHRDTGITEPVIIEYGFLDSSLDDVEQLKRDYSAYARAVARAIAQYSGIEFSSDGVYTVKAGDSLWSIAKKLNVSVEDLKNANNLNNNLLRIGQILKIPEVEESTEYKVYIVKAGDNLYSIARENNTTVNDLLNYNNLSTNALNVGQQLLIPTTMLDESDSNYLTYTVRNGDSLYRIANTYDVTIDEIIALNNLNTTLLSVGQVLRIPFNNMSDNLSSSNYIEYIVKAGDSLYKISNQYDTTINELLTYNNLNLLGTFIAIIFQFIFIPFCFYLFKDVFSIESMVIDILILYIAIIISIILYLHKIVSHHPDTNKEFHYHSNE